MTNAQAIETLEFLVNNQIADAAQEREDDDDEMADEIMADVAIAQPGIAAMRIVTDDMENGGRCFKLYNLACRIGHTGQAGNDMHFGEMVRIVKRMEGV